VAPQVLVGLTVPVEWKNVENIAEQVGGSTRWLQEFLSDSPWNDEGCIEELQRLVGEGLGADDGVLILCHRHNRVGPGSRPTRCRTVNEYRARTSLMIVCQLTSIQALGLIEADGAEVIRCDVHDTELIANLSRPGGRASLVEHIR
jgi:hypothetical protein